MRDLLKRVSTLENKTGINDRHLLFFDGVASKEDCIKLDLPLGVSVKDVLKLRPDIEILSFTELGEIEYFPVKMIK